VRPFYLGLLHGNFTRADEPDGSSFRHALSNAASAISDEQIEKLLTDPEWRGRLCAAWFAGLNKRGSLIPVIGDRLMASEMVYARQGYCVALGLITSDECARLLRSYLNAYLPLNRRVYNQEWALGALAHIEGTPPPEYLEQPLWRDGTYFMDPGEGIRKFSGVVSYLRQHRMSESAN
jgi:hypothetical protein